MRVSVAPRVFEQDLPAPEEKKGRILRSLPQETHLLPSTLLQALDGVDRRCLRRVLRGQVHRQDRTRYLPTFEQNYPPDPKKDEQAHAPDANPGEREHRVASLPFLEDRFPDDG